MSVQMTPTNRAILAMVVVAVLGGIFWTQLLSPKRDEVKELGADVERLEASLAQHEAEVAEAEAARDEFPKQYQRLVVLGKAVPRDEDVASLLVQVNRTADKAKGTFREIVLTPAGGEAPEAAAPATTPGEEPASPTEVSAALMPLGASIGTAGLAVMPYEVAFEGKFFEVANFIAGLDRMVKTGDQEVTVDGRLVTINGFSLVADPDKQFPWLEANFSLTTYLTPPSSETPAAEAPGAAPPATATPAATTTGGAP
jgi:Tfp pilus assembly protein PilO